MYKWLIGIAIVLISATLAISLPFKNKTTLTWDASTSPDVAGYKTYWSATGGLASYTDLNSKDVGNVLTVQIPTLGNFTGNQCFVVTAYDVAGNESDFSNEFCSQFVIKKNPPTNLR